MDVWWMQTCAEYMEAECINESTHARHWWLEMIRSIGGKRRQLYTDIQRNVSQVLKSIASEREKECEDSRTKRSIPKFVSKMN